MGWWDQLQIPIRPDDDELSDIEVINPAEAYRRQALAINLSGPLYAELELTDLWLRKAKRIESEIRRQILAQEMAGLKHTQTRTNDLVDAYILASAERFKSPTGKVKDIRPFLLRLRRRIERLEAQKERCERRLRALANMADYCDRILNWAKHEARLQLTQRG
jgi:hypothetical protein